jgi:hypothetical protein
MLYSALAGACKSSIEREGRKHKERRKKYGSKDNRREKDRSHNRDGRKDEADGHEQSGNHAVSDHGSDR